MAMQSMRFTKKGHRYQVRKVVNWKAQARQQMISQLPADFTPFVKPLMIKDLTYVFPIPKSFPKYKIGTIKDGFKIYKETRPDLMDNLSKSLWDCCEGILFLNDSQIVSHKGELCKIYGFKPRIEFEIEEIK